MKEENYLTVKEIADLYGVTTSGVYYWIGEGLEYQIEKVIGVKPRKVIYPSAVEEFLGLTKKKD